MIHTNRIVTVGEQESIIDRPIVLYRGDREVEIEFTLVGNEFTFSEEGNVIKSVNASHGQLVLNTPSGGHMFSELAECHEGKVVFVVTKEMIDEFIEMGFYIFQIRLYDSAEMKSRVTIPPVMNGFDIRNPIAAEDETNVVDQGIVDYARIFKDQSNEELPTFDWQGNYNKTEWVHHDVITENKLNKIEDALYSINANIKESDVVMLNTLDNVKKDADKYVKEHMAEVEADVDEFERNLNTDVQQFKIDTNAAMTAHKNEVSEELESVNSQLEQIAYIKDLSELRSDCINLLTNKEYDIKSFNTNMDNFTIKGLNDTVLTGEVSRSISLNGKNVVFENIIFKNFDTISLTNCNVTFKNCKFFDIWNTAITLTNSQALIEQCECNSTGLNPNKVIQYQGCFVYSQKSNVDIINNIISNTRGQGAIIFIESNVNCSYNTISDTAYRAIEFYSTNNKGIVSFNKINRCGYINTDNTGVGCNGIFASGEADVNVISNIITNVYENGIEGGFNVVKDNYIENTGVAVETNPTPSTEGIWCSGKQYINNTIVNPHLEGFRITVPSSTRSNLILQNNTIIKGSNSSTEQSFGVYGKGLSNSIVKNNMCIGYDNFIYVSERDITDGTANVVFSGNSSGKNIINPKSHIANFIVEGNHHIPKPTLKVKNLDENGIKLSNCNNSIDTDDGVQVTSVNQYGSSLYKDIESPFTSSIVQLTAQVKATGSFVLRIIPLVDGNPNYSSAVTRTFESNGSLVSASLCCTGGTFFRVDIRGTTTTGDVFTVKKMSAMVSNNENSL